MTVSLKSPAILLFITTLTLAISFLLIVIGMNITIKEWNNRPPLISRVNAQISVLRASLLDQLDKKSTKIPETTKNLREMPKRISNDIIDVLTIHFYTAYLSLNHPPAIADWLEKQIDVELYNMKEICMQNVIISAFPHEAFEFFVNLENLVVSSCGLSGKLKNLGSCLPKLSKLDLSGNNLTSIPNLAGMRRITLLDLSNNINLKVEDAESVVLFDTGRVLIAGTKITDNDVKKLKKLNENIDFIGL